MAEWLGNGLQNRGHRFNSGSRLHFIPADRNGSGFLFVEVRN